MWSTLVKMKSPKDDLSGKEEKHFIPAKTLMDMNRIEFDKFMNEHELSYDYYLNGYTYWKKPIVCKHEWVEYIGFTDRYNYCTKCDLKDRK